MNEEYDESLVEFLPKIGEPKNIKTVKQGRNVSLTSGYIDEAPLNSGNQKKFNLRLTCLRIIQHEKSSKKQKEWAKKIMEKGSANSVELKFVMNFARNNK